MAALADPKLKDKPQPDASKLADGVEGANKPEIKAEDAELGKPAMAFIERSLGLTGRKKKEDKLKPEDDSKTVEEDDKELDAVRQSPPKKKPTPKPVATPPPQTIDEDKLGEAVGRAITKGMEKRDKPTEPAGPELPPEVKSKLVMYERLEKHFPDKYKGHAKKFLANAQKFTAYSEKWEKEHPGQEFDDTAEEHESFRSTLEAETEYDEDDNVSALASDIADGRVAKVKEEFAGKLAPYERQLVINQKRQEIEANRDKIGDRFWQRMGDGFADVLDEHGQLNPKALAELKASDPVAHDTAINGAAFVERMATDVFMLDNGLADYDPNNPNHKFLSDFSMSQEQRMADRPIEKQTDDQGRRFMGRGEYNKLDGNQRSRHWTFTHEDLGYLLAAQIAKQTQAHLQSEEEKFSARAKARGLLKDDQSLPSKSQRQAPRQQETEDDGDDKPISPTTPTAPRLASSRGKTATVPTEPVSGFVLRSIRGR